MINILLFEDTLVPQLHPIAATRPAHATTCASYRLIDLLASADSNIVSLVRPQLAQLQQLDFPFLAASLDSSRDWTMLVNARIAPSVSSTGKLLGMAEQPQQWSVIDDDGSLLAAMTKTTELPDPEWQSLTAILDSCSGFSREELPLPVFRYPHDVIRCNMELMAENLQDRLANSRLSELERSPGVHVGENTAIDSRVAFDTSAGPIVIERNVRIKPFVYLEGPLYIGPGCTINEHAAIKDGVCFSHTIKAGGEIEATVVEPYSNKQHHGFLGHSYLGSWINLGAGTCNSDLKNTYGEIAMTYGDQRIATGMQFVGCVLGDYVKSAINTSIFTGKTVGVGSMLYGFIAANVPDFVNYAQSFGSVTATTPEVMQKTQQRMFARRGVEQRPEDIGVLKELYRTADPTKLHSPGQPVF